MLVPQCRHSGKLDVVCCGPYKLLGVLNKGENVKLDILAWFDGLCICNHDSIKPHINRHGQPVCEFPMPPVKTGALSRLIKILARRRVGSKKRRTFLCRCEFDDNTWFCESSKADEEPVYLDFLRLTAP